MPEILKVCHDRVLPQRLFEPQRTVTIHGALRAIFPIKQMWVNGSELRVRFMGGTPAQQRLAEEQAEWWTPHANLKFLFNNAPDAQIRVAFDPNDGAWSYVGTDCLGIPPDQPTMNLGFLDGGTAAHEFGHAIGCAHEHQNPRVGIQWNEEVVIRDLAGAPNFWSAEKARHNVIDKYAVDQIRGTDFDPDSIMLYFFPGTWVRSGIGTKANNVLSNMDKSFVGSSQIYPRTTVQVVELGVNARKSTSATIGLPGEEDLFQFTVKAAGRHVIQTSGQTDVVMKLLGPNSRTSLIAEDDDGGLGSNARIAVSLIPGQYFVQVRHFNTSGGTGSYSIKVRR